MATPKQVNWLSDIVLAAGRQVTDQDRETFTAMSDAEIRKHTDRLFRGLAKQQNTRRPVVPKVYRHD